MFAHRALFLKAMKGWIDETIQKEEVIPKY
jgi:hypothetical protein